jgi:hypothetical protein
VHALQDLISVEQPGGPGAFEIPRWDSASQKATRDALLALATQLPDTKGMFGPRATSIRYGVLSAPPPPGAAIRKRKRSISMSRRRRTTARPSTSSA